jgi:hypothetical protein
MRTRGRAFRCILAVLALSFAAGCARTDGQDPGEGRVYTVRGEIRQLPDPAQPGSGLYILHEAIPDFTNREGQAIGMEAMTMPFPVEEEVSLEGVQPGEPVEFELRVDWEGSPEVQITALRELPAGTKLALDPPPQP